MTEPMTGPMTEPTRMGSDFDTTGEEVEYSAGMDARQEYGSNSDSH